MAADPSMESCSPHVNHKPTQNPRRSTCGIKVNLANPGGSLILFFFVLNASTFLWAFSFQKKPHTPKGAGLKTLQEYFIAETAWCSTLKTCSDFEMKAL